MLKLRFDLDELMHRHFGAGARAAPHRRAPTAGVSGAAEGARGVVAPARRGHGRAGTEGTHARRRQRDIGAAGFFARGGGLRRDTATSRGARHDEVKPRL